MSIFEFLKVLLIIEGLEILVGSTFEHALSDKTCFIPIRLQEHAKKSVFLVSNFEVNFKGEDEVGSS